MLQEVWQFILRVKSLSETTLQHINHLQITLHLPHTQESTFPFISFSGVNKNYFNHVIIPGSFYYLIVLVL